MVNILDILYSLVSEIRKCVPKSKHYIGNLTEGFKTPSFLYLLVFNKDTRCSKFVKDTVVDIQIIYFGTNDKYSKTDLEEKLKVMHQLKQFLSTFHLQVKDRNLKFSYSFNDADDQLALNMQFNFKDGLVDTQFDEEQAREMIERIFINEKEVI